MGTSHQNVGYMMRAAEQGQVGRSDHSRELGCACTGNSGFDFSKFLSQDESNYYRTYSIPSSSTIQYVLRLGCGRVAREYSPFPILAQLCYRRRKTKGVKECKDIRYQVSADCRLQTRRTRKRKTWARGEGTSSTATRTRGKVSGRPGEWVTGWDARPKQA